MDFGKYAWFIWTSYGVFALFVGGIVVQSLIVAARTRRQLERLTDEQGRPRP